MSAPTTTTVDSPAEAYQQLTAADPSLVRAGFVGLLQGSDDQESEEDSLLVGEEGLLSLSGGPVALLIAGE